MNLKLIEFHVDLTVEGEFSAWTVLFTDLDRGRRLVATIDAGALFEPAKYPACEAFDDVERLAHGKLEAVEYPSQIIIGLVKAAISDAGK